jgi:hypothetical protein
MYQRVPSGSSIAMNDPAKPGHKDGFILFPFSGVGFPFEAEG